MESYKKAWTYVKKYKRYLFTMIIFLVIFQFLSALSPLIIQDILDNQLLGISGDWYQTTSTTDGISFEGKYYQKQKTDGDVFSVVYLNDQFYYSTEVIPPGSRSLIGDKIYVDGSGYPVTKLTQAQTKQLYSYQQDGITRDVILLAVVLALSILASYIQRINGSLLTVNTTRDVRLETARKFEYIDINILESEPVGKTANRMMADSIGVSMLYTSTINIFISSALSIAFSFWGMFVLSPKAALVCMIIIPIMIVWIKVFTSKINQIAVKVNETNSRIVARVNEIINGISILKIFNSEKMTVEDFQTLNDKYIDEKMEEVHLHLTIGWNGINLFQGVVIAVVIGVLTWINLQGISVIEAGIIYAYYTYISKIIAPLNLLFHEFGNLEHSKVKIDRIFKILSEEEEDNQLVEIPKYKGDITFENVTFSYGEKPAIKNFSLHINSGQKIGLVGRSGSGKSTIINLLMRFNDLKPTDIGQIYMDGVEINKHSKRTYRSHLGIILQEPILFQGTLADNLRFGADASEEKLVETMELIGASGVLEKFDNNINYEIYNNGANLSLGEKQLISLARVIIRDPQVLIMDEATANIDTETEELINYALGVVAKNRTVIVVAHRLSTIRDADQILVMEDGVLVEAGNHDFLLGKNGKYMEMYRNQVGI